MSSRELEPAGVGASWPATSNRNPLAVTNPVEAAGYGNGEQAAFDLNIATLWQIIWEWRWLILSALAAGLGLAIVYTLLATPIYRSAAVVEISSPNVRVMNDQSRDDQVTVDSNFLETQIGLFKSRALADRVAQDLNLASNETLVGDTDLDRSTRQRIAAGNLRSNLMVEKVGTSRLIRITFASVDPALSARIVNGFADGFISSSLERRYQSSSYAREFLERQIGTVRRDLENSERQLVAYAQRQQIINTGGGASESGSTAPAGDTASLTGAALIQLNNTLAEATGKRIAAEQAYRSSLSSGLTAEVGERTAALRNNRTTLQAEYQDKLSVFRPDYPEMVRLKARIDSLAQAIATEERAVRTGRSGTLSADYRAAQAAEGRLRAQVAQLRGDVLSQRGRSIQYNILQREVDTNRALYDALLQKYKEIGVTGGVGVSYASVVDRGDVSAAPYSPSLIFNILIGLGLGLTIGLGLALLLEFVNDTIKTPDDVRDRLRLAFLGGVPTSKGKKPAEVLRDQSSPVTEAFFSIGTSLSFSTNEGAPSTLLVTSTRPGEGKSTTTWALAQYFARLGKSVVLIDADLRKPAFVTGHEKEDGLSNLLTNHDPIAPHIVETDIANLWLLPCGPIPPNPAELLASPRMQNLINEAATSFDVVIVDGPPILGLADAPLLSMNVRGTLMVVESGKTRTRAATEALNRMREAGANMVGCVLMRYRHDSTGYGYRYEAYAYKSLESKEREIRAIGAA